MLGVGVTGDIWSTGAFSFESPLKDLLDTGVYTVEQLLAEDELLQELRGVHAELIQFFSKEEALSRLIHYVIQPPEAPVPTDLPPPLDNEKDKHPERDPENFHVRFPYMSCEVICCEIDAILDTIMQGKTEDGVRILDVLFSVLYKTEPGQLDDYRAGYFDKIFSVLCRKRANMISEYINENQEKRESLMQAMFKHLYAHSIMQIVQRLLLPQRPVPQEVLEKEVGEELIPSEDPEPTNSFVRFDWSGSDLALEMLLDILTGPDSLPESEEEAERRLDQSLNAAEVLVTIIQNSMLASKTMLMLTSSPIVLRLIKAATTLKGEEEYFSPQESLLTSAMNVLESLILQLGGYGAIGTMTLVPEDEGGGPDDPSSADEPLIADLSSFLEHLPLFLSSLCHLLRHPSTKTWTSPMQYSRTSPQLLLGNSRLRIVRVLESLVLLGEPSVDAHLVKSDCLEICLDLFWEFQWCSMLHQSVANLLVHVFEGKNARIQMQEYFLVKCNLLGRLMESFVESSDAVNAQLPAVVMNLKDVDVVATSSVGSEKGSTGPLSISEDDVDAVLEKQEEESKAKEEMEHVSTEAVQNESTDPSTAGVMASPAQSFRFGYMGHVIIICQALVHACANSGAAEDEEQGAAQMNGEKNKSDHLENNGEEVEEDSLLAQLVATHPLCEKWSEFVATTLATETAIQSTPLGGFSMTAAVQDPIHGHRPGVLDDGDFPPQSLYSHDMDVEKIAASLMAKLNFGRFGIDDDDMPDEDVHSGSGSGDSERSYNSGETANDRTGYLFDDPLGKSGGLGIELGKLTKYVPDEGSDGGQEEEEEEDDSSSDEEIDRRRKGSDGDVPVMDLFAGNFQEDELTPQQVGAEPPPSEWSDFANFDDSVEEFGDFEGSAGNLSQNESSNPEIDEIFGPGDHATLLEEGVSEMVSDFVAFGSGSSDAADMEAGDTNGSTPSQTPNKVGTSDEFGAFEGPNVSPAESRSTGESPSVPTSTDEAEAPESDEFQEIVEAPSDELQADYTPRGEPSSPRTKSESSPVHAAAEAS